MTFQRQYIAKTSSGIKAGEEMRFELRLREAKRSRVSESDPSETFSCNRIEARLTLGAACSATAKAACLHTSSP